MNDVSKILNYLMNEKDCTEIVADKLTAKLTKYDDIKQEFLHWLETGEFIKDNPLRVGGYTAMEISAMAPMLDGAGVCNFMVTLRDDPETAQEIIDDGFSVK